MRAEHLQQNQSRAQPLLNQSYEPSSGRGAYQTLQQPRQSIPNGREAVSAMGFNSHNSLNNNQPLQRSNNQ